MNAGKPYVLVVEDDTSTQTLYRFILEDRVQVLMCTNVADALQHLQEHSVSLAIIDLSLEGSESGLELIQTMKSKRRWRKIPAIAVTAHAFPLDKRNAIEAGCDEYHAKPVGQATIDTLLETYL